ncbi:hypothetical protein CLV30_101467 [Haloactinopolyspora alba]|uniref:Uncharacterized protein n=1 Tax=Haloactinopolyspora alba TaxID=648780 RepID=A0A2P8EGB6_9ACTN|nr:hypothetical protein [Haloactinopolyspora alba]PSL08495.1 hypothetical protein CLV30_101467 [Haloactinopolyspora alba]
MTTRIRGLTPDDVALVEFARGIVDAHGDGSTHTMGAAVRGVDVTDLLPFGGQWTPDQGTLPYDPQRFDDTAGE